MAWSIGNEARNLRGSIDAYRAEFLALPCVYLETGELESELQRLLDGLPATAPCQSRPIP